MAIDWTELQERYHGKWVALDQDEQTVLGVGATAKEATDAAREKKHEHPILLRMPETVAAYVGATV